LCRGDSQDINRHAGRGRQRLAQEFAQDSFDFASMTKGRCHEGMGKGAVPALQFTKLGICFKQLIKRLLIECNALQQADGSTSGLQARLLIFWGCH
jgi:hypothetical protein